MLDAWSCWLISNVFYFVIRDYLGVKFTIIIVIKNWLKNFITKFKIAGLKGVVRITSAESRKQLKVKNSMLRVK